MGNITKTFLIALTASAFLLLFPVMSATRTGDAFVAFDYQGIAINRFTYGWQYYNAPCYLDGLSCRSANTLVNPVVYYGVGQATTLTSTYTHVQPWMPYTTIIVAILALALFFTAAWFFIHAYAPSTNGIILFFGSTVITKAAVIIGSIFIPSLLGLMSSKAAGGWYHTKPYYALAQGAGILLLYGLLERKKAFTAVSAFFCALIHPSIGLVYAITGTSLVLPKRDAFIPVLCAGIGAILGMAVLVFFIGIDGFTGYQTTNLDVIPRAAETLTQRFMGTSTALLPLVLIAAIIVFNWKKASTLAPHHKRMSVTFFLLVAVIAGLRFNGSILFGVMHFLYYMTPAALLGSVVAAKLLEESTWRNIILACCVIAFVLGSLGIMQNQETEVITMNNQTREALTTLNNLPEGTVITTKDVTYFVQGFTKHRVLVDPWYAPSTLFESALHNASVHDEVPRIVSPVTKTPTTFHGPTYSLNMTNNSYNIHVVREVE